MRFHVLDPEFRDRECHRVALDKSVTLEPVKLGHPPSVRLGPVVDWMTQLFRPEVKGK